MPKKYQVTLLAVVIAVAAAGIGRLATAEETSSVDVKVMNWNIRGGDTALGAVAKKIAEAEPDVVTLQEVHRNDKVHQVKRLAAKLDMHAHMGEADENGIGGVAGNAVLSKFPIMEKVTKKLPNRSDSNTVDRAMPGVKLDLPGKTNLRVFTTHLTMGMNGNNSAERLEQAKYCVDYLKHDGPLLFTGDFNATPGGNVYPTVTKAGFTDTGKQHADDPTHGDARIDYIFARGMKATGGKVIPTKLSDHRPMVMNTVVG